MQPLEVLSPFLREPYLPGRQPIHMELLPKLRSLFMASYFGFDHLVWLGSVNIIKDKKFLERCAAASVLCFYTRCKVAIMVKGPVTLLSTI